VEVTGTVPNGTVEESTQDAILITLNRPCGTEFGILGSYAEEKHYAVENMVGTRRLELLTSTVSR
jgi:hypothetical protein